MRNDLVGEYVGQTAPRTKRVLEQAMGGRPFIDQAYYLFNIADSRDFGQEAIGILLQVIWLTSRDKLVVILALAARTGWMSSSAPIPGCAPGLLTTSTSPTTSSVS